MFNNNQEIKEGDTVRFSYWDGDKYVTGTGVVKIILTVLTNVESDGKRFNVKTNSLIKV